MKSIYQLFAVVAALCVCVCAVSASFSEDEAAFQALFDKGINGVLPTVAEIDGLEIRFLKFQFDVPQPGSGRSNSGVQALPIYTITDRRTNSTEAGRICTAEGQRLAIIKTREQQAAIETVLATAGVPWNVWIGGGCKLSFGTYYHTWDDGTMPSNFWNNLADGPAITCRADQVRDGLMMYGPKFNQTQLIYKWRLEYPEEGNYFICESLASARSAALTDPFVAGVAGVAPIVTEFQGSEVRFLPFVNSNILVKAADGADVQEVPDYFVSNFLANASDAESLCIAEGLNPLSIKSQSEQSRLEVVIATTGLGGKIWTSGRCVTRFGSVGYWEWKDGTRLSIFWNNLLNGPDVECSTDVDQRGNRLEMFGSQYTNNYRYKWNSQFPQVRNYVVCQS